MHRAWWTIVVVLATGIAAYATAVLLLPHFGPPFVAELRTHLLVPLSMHLAGGAIALAVGAWQVNAEFRHRHVSVHRRLGQLYVVAVVVGAIGAGILAPSSQQGAITHWGFGCLAIAWFGTTIAAYQSIRRREFDAHRRWMLRSYALTLAAVTLRIYLPLSQIAGLPFGPSYQAISWLCWVPNVLMAEWFVVRRVHVVPVRAPA